ncbi:hypothetical protein GUITHDRAFT_110354 [Guillardia theta CCMP2712]|uniref:PDZ domain-containing protein n=1 Tax=Guillardia theta (strain CCMP2712) TaxID=905079 RepID=L1J4T9_GUITC|nr:hypothetical protein GUITHDRAFT_110354 [Guillardia theta CCMP2712]EKX43548.1 hypothetical protein GUITHDRAFT_110354 [Guillardia theta CCMP2712]|eukprot:XP_005830528.1 hypothetical protein GUITHDRAFT_110354 [Guillardia theta CCMP2712]
MGAAESHDAPESSDSLLNLSCCETRHKKRGPLHESRPLSSPCGIGMGLDSQMLAEGRGAVVICLAKDGPAERDGKVQIGDSILFVDDLDLRELMNNSGKMSFSGDIPSLLARALLGEEGSTVRLGISRKGEPGILYREVRREHLKPRSQWLSAHSNASRSME